MAEVEVRALTEDQVPQTVRERVVAAAKAALADGREPRLADLRAVGLQAGVSLGVRAVASLVLEARVLEAERRLRTTLGRGPTLQEVMVEAGVSDKVALGVLRRHGLIRRRKKKEMREEEERQRLLRERPDIEVPPVPRQAAKIRPMPGAEYLATKYGAVSQYQYRPYDGSYVWAGGDPPGTRIELIPDSDGRVRRVRQSDLPRVIRPRRYTDPDMETVRGAAVSQHLYGGRNAGLSR